MGKSLLLLCAALAFSACSFQKDMDKTVDNTDKVAEVSDRIQGDSDHLAKRTDDLENELVGKESPTIQVDKLDELFGDGQYAYSLDHDARQHPDLIAQYINEPNMLLYAGFSIQAMHFQYWKGDYNEPLSVLDNYFEESTEILFAHCTKHIPRTFAVDVTVPNRDYFAVASLGAKADRVRPEYIRNLKAHGLHDLSLYDVMIMALQDRDRLTRNEILPKAVSMVLQWKQEAIYMLQLRHNYQPLMVLGRMSNLQDLGGIGKLEDTLPVVGGLKISLDDKDPEELKAWTEWLKSALVTRRQLTGMGIKPEYNSTFRKLLASADFGQEQLLADKSIKPGTLRAVQRDFAAAYTSVLADFSK